MGVDVMETMVVSQPVVVRLRARVSGAVQGVGFRPFVHTLATGMGLTGTVQNSTQGVLIEVEGPREMLEKFIARLQKEKPAPASIHGLEYSFLDSVGHGTFTILESNPDNGQDTARSALVMSDIATCADCLLEMRDPSNRRYRYPFTNCTHCGPRFTIIEDMPYDRCRTSMKKFALCEECQREYQDPTDRRFHAQPNACPECGPHLELWDARGKVLAEFHPALKKAVRALREGQIVAVKGLGGFHLMANAWNEAVVLRLRLHKHREEKPFALMVPDVASIARDCFLEPLEEAMLFSPEAPIVLLRRRKEKGNVVESVAPNNPNLGVMLPYTPLHHLLMSELGLPVVATSGNMSEEPICIDEQDALVRLRGMADVFLVHDRPIVRHADDSVVRMMAGRAMVLRRARGFAPMPVTLKASIASDGYAPFLAVGGHLKNTVCLPVGREAFVSQHVGDLESKEGREAFVQVANDFQRLYGVTPQRMAVDMHPGYASTNYAEKTALPLIPVQHHHAHILSCMAENDLEGPALGVAWDGSGWGPDGTVWGGEFLRVDGAHYQRVVHLRLFSLPGAEKAVREPRRSALGLLHEIFGLSLEMQATFTAVENKLLVTMLQGAIHAPRTSSAGRLFDAVASLTGLRHISRFEGQAAMELEWSCEGFETQETYPYRIGNDGILDWEPMIRQLLKEKKHGAVVGSLAAKFHNTLSEIIVAVAQRAGEQRVVLSGGCFQNKVLTEKTIALLQKAGFKPYWHQRIPPNDGGIALGQAVAALATGDRI